MALSPDDAAFETEAGPPDFVTVGCIPSSINVDGTCVCDVGYAHTTGLPGFPTLGPESATWVWPWGACEPCGVGWYQDTVASGWCKRCPLNTFTDTPASVKCSPCPAGSYAGVASA
eukprot:3699571-Rhodomonas_salina.1